MKNASHGRGRRSSSNSNAAAEEERPTEERQAQGGEREGRDSGREDEGEEAAPPRLHRRREVHAVEVSRACALRLARQSQPPLALSLLPVTFPSLSLSLGVYV